MGEDLLLASGSDIYGRLLETVDEYNLYCYYLGYPPEINRALLSPIRVDKRPSFVIFESTKYLDREYLWKDMGTGQSGDIFALVQHMYGYSSKREAYEHIAAQLEGKGGEHRGVVLTTYPKPVRSCEIEIRIRARDWLRADLDYWASQGISLPTLNTYRVSPVQYYWMVANQQCPNTAEPYTYAYRNNADGKILYKLYRPKSSTHKFRNNYNPSVIEGYEQLPPNGNLLIITKSTKECMWLHENMDIPAVAGRSETTYLTDDQIEHLYSRFSDIISFMDNDDTGYKSADHYEMRSIPAIHLPENGPKDITDYTLQKGLPAAIQEFTQLISPWL